MANEVKLSEREKKIVEMKKAGGTYASIAEHLGIQTQEVYKALFKAGMTRPAGQRRKVTDDIKQRIIEDRMKGATYMQLSVTHGVSTTVINRILNEAGLIGERFESPTNNEEGGEAE